MSNETKTETKEFLENVEAIREGIEDFKKGNTKPAREALKELAEKLGISLKEDNK